MREVWQRRVPASEAPSVPQCCAASSQQATMAASICHQHLGHASPTVAPSRQLSVVPLHRTPHAARTSMPRRSRGALHIHQGGLTSAHAHSVPPPLPPCGPPGGSNGGGGGHGGNGGSDGSEPPFSGGAAWLLPLVLAALWLWPCSPSMAAAEPQGAAEWGPVSAFDDALREDAASVAAAGNEPLVAPA